MYRDDESAGLQRERNDELVEDRAQGFSAVPDSITSSDKFVRHGVLPEIESTSPIRTVFAILSQRPDSGFVLTQFGRANRYVLGASLASAFLEKAKANRQGVQRGIAESADTPVGEWISAPSVRSFAIEDRITASAGAQELENGPEAVFRIGSSSLKFGYFLNHESVRYAAVGRVVWICGNPQGQHENPDPDHGSCGFCPFPIDHTEVR